MRQIPFGRIAAALVGGLIAGVAVSSPAYAFAHDRVSNPYLHAVLDVLTLAVVSAPLWTAYLWGGQRRAYLIGLVALIQLPVAVIGFTPILNPTLHATALVLALAVTAAAIWYVRRATRGAPARTVAVSRH